jgi:hypothetical protein
MSIRPEAYSMLPAVVPKKRVNPKKIKKVNKPEGGLIKKGLKLTARAALSPLSLGLTGAVVATKAIKKAGKKIVPNKPLRRSFDKRGRFVI